MRAGGAIGRRRQRQGGAFEQRGCERGTIDRDEGTRRTLPPAMDRAGGNLFACSAFAEQQDRRIRRCDPPQDLLD